jgi:hypothetical protein
MSLVGAVFLVNVMACSEGIANIELAVVIIVILIIHYQGCNL